MSFFLFYDDNAFWLNLPPSIKNSLPFSYFLQNKAGRDLGLNVAGTSPVGRLFFFSKPLTGISRGKTGQRRTVESVLDAYLFYQLIKMRIYLNREKEKIPVEPEFQDHLNELQRKFRRRPDGWSFTSIPTTAISDSRIDDDEIALLERQFAAVNLEGVVASDERQKRIRRAAYRLARISRHVRALQYQPDKLESKEAFESAVFNAVDYALIMVNVLPLLESYVALKDSDQKNGLIQKEQLALEIYTGLSAHPEIFHPKGLRRRLTLFQAL
jgi:hypothetical protein